jgi:hypothetical protein
MSMLTQICAPERRAFGDAPVGGELRGANQTPARGEPRGNFSCLQAFDNAQNAIGISKRRKTSMP